MDISPFVNFRIGKFYGSEVAIAPVSTALQKSGESLSRTTRLAVQTIVSLRFALVRKATEFALLATNASPLPAQDDFRPLFGAAPAGAGRFSGGKS